MTNVTVGHYSEEEFAKVTPENKGNRTPRWEAEPNYGLPRPAPAPGAAPAPAGGINFPGGEGRRKLAEGLEGLPIVKPPYGVLAAIDLKNPDKLLFQVPHGDTPDNIRNHPLLKGMNIPKTGQSGSVGVLITKTFVAAGDPGITTVNNVRGASLRAYDKMTGAQVGEVRVPAPVVGHPMTYSINGRQYIVVGVSGGNYTGEYIAFRLPASELPPHQHRAASSNDARRQQFEGTGSKESVPFCFWRSSVRSKGYGRLCGDASTGALRSGSLATVGRRTSGGASPGRCEPSCTSLNSASSSPKASPVEARARPAPTPGRGPRSDGAGPTSGPLPSRRRWTTRRDFSRRVQIDRTNPTANHAPHWAASIGGTSISKATTSLISISLRHPREVVAASE